MRPFGGGVKGPKEWPLEQGEEEEEEEAEERAEGQRPCEEEEGEWLWWRCLSWC